MDEQTVNLGPRPDMGTSQILAVPFAALTTLGYPMPRRSPSPALPDTEDLVDLQPMGEDQVATWFHGRRPSAGGMPVTVAILHRTATGMAVRARLQDQGEAILALRHPQVAPVLNLAMEVEAPTVVMGRPAGQRLWDRLNGEPIPLAQALAWSVDLCRALEALQEAGLAHLGIDAHRVWIDGDHACVTDLGMAPTAPPDAPRADHACLAPEQLLGLPADLRADVHAVGCLLFRTCTGSWPAIITDRASLEAWARGDLPEDRLTGLASGPAAVLRRALARRMADRYSGPTPLREDLERLLHGFSPLHARPQTTRTLRAPGTATVDHLRPPPISRRLPSPPAEPRGPAPARRKAPSLLVAGVLGGLCLLGTGAWLLRPTATAAPVAPEKSWPTWAVAGGTDAHGPWLELSVGDLRPRLRAIPAGTSWIGSAADEPGRQRDEDRFLARTSRKVWMLDREVDQLLYVALTGANPSHFRGMSLPVENLSWDEAERCCQALARANPGLVVRLPTEVEWEMACRAGGSGPFGTPTFWDVTRSDRITRPVATLEPNAWGFHDLHGNVMEWTRDALAPYPTDEVTDRQVATGAQRVVRGGAWCSTREDCRSARRSGLMSKAHLPYLGFRFVVEER